MPDGDFIADRSIRVFCPNENSDEYRYDKQKIDGGASPLWVEPSLDWWSWVL